MEKEKSINISIKLIKDRIKRIKEGLQWNDLISKQYNFRISLTHYYFETYDLLIEKHLKKDFPYFIKEIENLEKKYGDQR